MSTTSIGRQAESAVTEFLKDNNYDILARNWKTRTCEIDIIAYRDETIYFVEVKYRRNAYQGDGFDYINAPKLRRMEYAAQLWICKNNWYGQFALSAASVYGDDFEVRFINQL